MITIMFSCKGCGLEKHKLQIPAREDEDLLVWMEKVKGWVADEHHKVSQNCRTERCDLYLPMPPEAEFVGQQIE